MDFLKELFGDKPLTFDELSAKVKEKGLKIADLAGGQYVEKAKHDRLSGEHDTLKTKLKETEDKLAEHLKLIDGDAGLKKQVADLQKDLKKAQDDLGEATGKITARDRMDAALEKVKGDKKLAKLLVMEAGEKVTDKVDFAAAMDEVMKADTVTYKLPTEQKPNEPKPNIYVKTPGMNNDKTPPEGTDNLDATLRSSMGLPPKQ